MTEPADESETWGQLGPAMRELNERQRAFVRFLVTEKPGYGALTRAYRKAGYGKNSKAATLSKEAHHLSRDLRIIEAIAEESKKVIRVGHPEAVAALFNMIRDPRHRDHARAVAAVLDRCDPAISKHSIDVTHRHEDPDRAALEELKALRQLGTPRQKLLELYGPNGLDRLEALEAVENAHRAAAAKIIDGEVMEREATNG
ncbi:MAG: hypothetical protein WBF58_08840 [Xanthobacteraceae bacterium]